MCNRVFPEEIKQVFVVEKQKQICYIEVELYYDEGHLACCVSTSSCLVPKLEAALNILEKLIRIRIRIV